MPKLFFTIGEVAKQLEVPISTIRYWEQEFPHIRPRNANPHSTRRYTQPEIERIQTIKYLIHDKGLSIKGAKDQLRLEGKTSETRSDTIHRLKTLLQRLRQLHHYCLQVEKTSTQ